MCAILFTPSCFLWASQVPDLSTFAAAAERTGLLELLSDPGSGPITVFAPRWVQGGHSVEREQRAPVLLERLSGLTGTCIAAPQHRILFSSYPTCSDDAFDGMALAVGANTTQDLLDSPLLSAVRGASLPWPLV